MISESILLVFVKCRCDKEIFSSLNSHNKSESVLATSAKRENARARIRVFVKPIPKKLDYPPDLQDECVKLVLEQAETLRENWAE